MAKGISIVQKSPNFTKILNHVQKYWREKNAKELVNDIVKIDPELKGNEKQVEKWIYNTNHNRRGKISQALAESYAGQAENMIKIYHAMKQKALLLGDSAMESLLEEITTAVETNKPIPDAKKSLAMSFFEKYMGIDQKAEHLAILKNSVASHNRTVASLVNIAIYGNLKNYNPLSHVEGEQLGNTALEINARGEDGIRAAVIDVPAR